MSRFRIFALFAAFAALAVTFAACGGSDKSNEDPQKVIEQASLKGVKSGELTAAEAKTLRGEEAGVKAEERAEVKANGGHLTKGKQKQLNQELNQDSKQIYAEKHD